MNWINSDSLHYSLGTAERIPIALRQIGTEMNLYFGRLWTELNSAYNRRNWWMNRTIMCWKTIMDPYLWAIASNRAGGQNVYHVTPKPKHYSLLSYITILPAMTAVGIFYSYVGRPPIHERLHCATFSPQLVHTRMNRHACRHKSKDVDSCIRMALLPCIDQSYGVV